MGMPKEKTPPGQEDPSSQAQDKISQLALLNLTGSSGSSTEQRAASCFFVFCDSSCCTPSPYKPSFPGPVQTFFFFLLLISFRVSDSITATSLYLGSILHMVDASGLIDALERDVLDQRAVADQLVLLAKVCISIITAAQLFMRQN